MSLNLQEQNIFIASPVNLTRTFWVSSATPGINSGNVYSTSKFPIFFGGTKRLNFYLDGGGTVVVNNDQTSTWVFYAVTLSKNSISVYVNGSLFERKVTIWNGDTNDISFGAYLADHFYTGYLDDMRLYPQVLPINEIYKIYNSSK